MTAKEFYQAGQLTEAIAKITEDIKADPADTRARVFLFELLCFSGDLVRAQKQLDAVAANDVDTEIAFARYRNLLSAEAVRRDVFAGKVRPNIPTPVPAYATKCIEALGHIATGSTGSAIALLEEAQELLPISKVFVNGESVEDFGDGDDVLRPFLEAIVEGAYCWIPWESVCSLSLSAPKYLRDLFWMPAQLILNSGQAGETYLPVLYSGSHLDQDDQIRLGRKTAWRTDHPGLSLGIGQRIFVAGETDRAMLDITELEFEHADASNAS